MGRMGYGPSVAQSMDLNTETESENNEQARNPKAGRGFLVFRPKQGYGVSETPWSATLGSDHH